MALDPAIQDGAQGAAIGTAILPGWGTAIGAGAGVLLGGAQDLFGGSGPSLQQQQQAAYAAQAAQNYARNQQQTQGQIGQLQQLQSGQRSVSAEQLRQGMQQNQAQQMSMAAGAAPQNAVMAMRQASINAGRMGSGLAGQQAVAGLQERNQATMALNGLLGNNGQLANSAALGGWGVNQNAQNAQYQQNLNQQNQIAGALAGAGSAYAMGQRQGGQPAPSGGYSYGDVNTATSDRRLKKNIKDGSKASDDMIAGLRAHLYDYKSEKSGPKGTHLGPMAQDLERIGSRSVINTAGGKVVHGARLALELAATTGRLGERLAKLEAAKGK